MKNIPKEILDDIITMINTSDFYNKIQIMKEGDETTTETFYWIEEGIAHSLVQENKDGESKELEPSQILPSEEVYERFSELPKDAEIIIAGNSNEHVLALL